MLEIFTFLTFVRFNYIKTSQHFFFFWGSCSSGWPWNSHVKEPHFLFRSFFFFLSWGLSIPGWPGLQRDLPASASKLVGLKMCVTTHGSLPRQFNLFGTGFLKFYEFKPSVFSVAIFYILSPILSAGIKGVHYDVLCKSRHSSYVYLHIWKKLYLCWFYIIASIFSCFYLKVYVCILPICMGVQHSEGIGSTAAGVR